MIGFYGRKTSDSVQKALWMLLETGEPHEHVELGGKFGGLDDPDFLKLNPHGRVPVLVDGDCVVWESNAIIRYLAAQYCAGTIWPDGPAERAEADKWMDWVQTRVYPEFNQLFWRTVRTPEADQNAAKIKTGNAQLNDYMARLDAQLDSKPYLAGPDLTIADIAAGATLYRYFEMPIARPRLPNLKRWYGTLSARPAYQQAVMVSFEELRGRLAF